MIRIKNIYFFDGAFGTYYYNQTKDNNPCELANLHNPQQVIAIHREYVQAGATAIKTNTFGVNSKLEADKSKRSKLIEAGFNLAKEAANNKAEIFADIGPLAGENEAEVALEYIENTELFLACGAENFLFETLSEFNLIKDSLAKIKQLKPNSTIIVSFASSQDGYTASGYYYRDLLQQAIECPFVDAVGLNCLCGPAHMLELVKKALPLNKPFSVMPNSGYPVTINGRTIYRDNAEYFAEKLFHIKALGVNILGGCCGTTPLHISLAIQRISQKQFANIADSLEITEKAIKQVPALSKKGQKYLAVEIDPPLDADCSFLLSAAKQAKDAGCDMITMADSPLARTRADSFIMAAKVKREIGIEVLPHLACRDRNHIAIKGLLMAAAMENIDHVLAITGDPPNTPDKRQKSGVFSFNSYSLISFMASLNKDVLNHSPMLIGAALNVNAYNFSNELKRAEKKQENGAGFFITQAIYSQQSVENCIKASQLLEVPVLAGIMPLASYRNAVFLQNEVAGIEVPSEIIENLKDKNEEETFAISLDYSLSLVKALYCECAGFSLMTPLKRIDLVIALIKEINQLAEEN